MHVGAGGPPRAALLRRAEGGDDGRQILAEVVAPKVLFPQHLVARVKVDVVAQPVVRLVVVPLPLDHQPERPLLRPLRRVRDPRRQQEDLALADSHRLAAAAVDDRQLHVAAQLVEELGALLQVEVEPLVRPADEHDRELAVVEQLVHHRRRERRRVLGEPGGHVGDRRRGLRAEAARARRARCKFAW